MPVIIDLMENTVIRGYYLQGKEEGKQEGKQEGARDEAMTMLTRQLERRFGPLPETVIARLRAADLATLEDWGLRMLDAGGLEEVFQSA